MPNTPDPITAPPKAVWPPVAVPGQPDDHRTVQEDSAAEPKASLPQPVSAPIGPRMQGDQVLADLAAQIERYVVLPSPEALTAVTLWVAATHLQSVWQHAPRLAVVGPAKRCGKSRLLDVITETVHDPLITVNASAAAIFRSIGESDPPTLLVDEVDTIFGSAKVAEKNEELRGLLNAGFQKSRYTLRVAGPNHEVVRFHTFAMAALAGIGDLPDTIMDRSVVMRMRRRRNGETVSEFRAFRDTPALHAVRDRLAAWLRPRGKEAIGLMPVSMPVEDRAADTWEPLVIIADLAGGDWPERARTACRMMTAHEAALDQDNSLHTRLLVDIRRAFAACGDPAALPTRTILTMLNRDEEAPWANDGAQGLIPRRLQILLDPFAIRSSTRRFPEGTQAKGFTRAQFMDAWDRYCPSETPSEPSGT
ncbi:DUF3631 domain-containing protein [Streptomyces lavendulae]|uniref:DUF3631 domain-containing protein n=1 Tax=Streptomyces lavendulae TaxID=1914 RepID=UPI0024A3E7D7|nr:hypothetical protein Slala01_44160 [Streptomyces lavendulae subsp. lavendulae]GLX28066.1 hypothetical protein Slala02_38860 [Streptomyces lavendulae subsp. lavendulae]